MLKLTKYEKALVALFILTLPLMNPWVRGDGVGYYAFARALLIEHRLDFTKDWLGANTSFRMGRVDANGQLTPEEYTSTGHIDNHFSAGPAILWAPFLIAAHAATILCDRLGGHIPADGFSKPYRLAMAFGTALYGFLAIFISFRLARRYVSDGWAFLAALGIWFGSSLPVYMYFNPSWSHAHSAFAVAVFAWYWNRTRGERTWGQWIVLGLLGGLMMNVYYMNSVVLLLPLLESLGRYRTAFKGRAWESASGLFLKNLLFSATILLAFSPTLITKKIIYGGYLKFGYGEHWFWTSPAFLSVCFSANHGLFSWTPIAILAVAGLFLLRKYDRSLALYLTVTFVAFAYGMGCYENWHGISSYGSRFFVSLTALFILGLAALFDGLAHAWRERRAAIVAWSGTTALVLWNLGLIFQWGMHLIPDRGPISFRAAAYNQVAVVPAEAERSLSSYLLHRRELMDRIEQRDVNQIKFDQTGP
ncbi:MAG TPA: glycosyltransferase family 39 protein [Verrucomicrobiae bacterium]|nr:glycosyltransferase family 39 protein [Verrucomicrobiae bacterium]